MLGAGVALLTALAWAGSSILLKLLTVRIDTLSINTLRLWAGSVLLVVIVLLSGRTQLLVGTPFVPALLVMASGIIAMAVGDTLYIKSLSVLDVSRVFPIAQCSFPLLTAFVAVLWLGEPFSWGLVGGAVMVPAGIYLIAVGGRTRGAPAPGASGAGKGIALALVAAVTWTVSAATLKVVVVGMDTFVAAAIRIPAAAAIVTLLALRNRPNGALRLRSYGSRTLSLAVLAGLLTYGLAAVGYVSAMQMIGAAKTVILTATAPLLALPLSMLILAERPTRHAVVGLLLCVAGVYLVVS